MNANAIIKKAEDGSTRLIAHIGEGSKRYFMLMEYDYITLKFSAATPTILRLGDYVEIENVGRYELTAPTRGEYNKKTGGYDYEIRLEAQYWKFKNKLCKFLPQIGSNETSWTYTDTLPNHAQQIIFNLRAQAYQRDDDGKETLIPGRQTFLYNGTTDWSIEWDDSVDTTKAVTIQYDKKKIIDAIADIAEAYECEWWFEQNILYFGKCEYGTTPVKLEINQELVDISRKDSKETYATRLYVYGSDRNIASNYRKSLIFDATVTNGKLYDPTRDIDIDWFINGAVTRIADISNSNTRAYNETINHQQCAAHYIHETNSSHTRVFTNYVYQSFDGSMEYQGTIHALSLSGLAIKFTQHTGSLTGNVRAHVILQVCLDKKSFDYPFDYFEFNVEAPIEALNKEITLRFSDQRIITRGIPTACMMQLDLGVDAREGEGYKREVSASIQGTAAISYYPKWKATGVTIEVLDKKTGAVASTIEGATFNADFADNQRKLTLPPGATISSGDKYQLPQLNKAIVPARYFTSIYTVFEKYKDITTNSIVNNRLLLPEEDEDGNPIKGYLDAFEFDCEEEAVEDVVVFDDIMPSRVSKIQSITRSDEYTTEQQEQDGSTTKETYREYIYTDDLFTADNPFNRGEYLIDGANLKVTFQSGLLNGMTFDVELLEDNYHFQIKRDDTTLLPNEVIKPKNGDEFILHGFNIAMLNDNTTDYISNAEKELLSKARQYIAKLNTDTSTYQCTVSCDIAYQVEEDSPDGLYLGIGRSVNLIHPGYFKDGRISRVLGYEIPLDFAYDNPVYFIGEKASYSRIGALEDKIAGVGNTTGNFAAVVGGGVSTGNGAGSPYVIQQLDSTPPTDKNVYSSLRARLEFALKTMAQTIKHLWTFAKGVRFGTFISGKSGAQIDAAGNAEVESLHVRSWLKVQELIYNRLNAQEGDTSFSDVGTIEELTDNADGTQTAKMRMRWSGDFTAFQPGDIVYGYVNNLNKTDAKEYHKAWAWIKSVNRSANELTLAAYADSETPAGTNHPMTEGMVISRWGNNIEPTLQTYINPIYSAVIGKRGDTYINKRQRTFFISCDSGNLVELMGVNKPKLEPGNYGTILGIIPDGLLDDNTEELINKDQPYLFARGIIVQDLIRIGYEGVTTRTANYRGQWSLQTAAHAVDYYRSTKGMFDTVTWNGALWQCVTTGTLDEPSDASGAWVKMTASLDDGNETRLWVINPSANIVSIRKNEIIPQRLSATVTLNSSENATCTFYNNNDLLNAGAKIYSSLDGINWSEFIIGNLEPLELEDESGVIELEDGDGGYLTVGGDDISTETIGDRIYFELRDANTDTVLASLQVPVVKDGNDGISLEVSPETAVFKRNGTQQRVKIYVDLYQGGQLVPYNNGSGDNGFICSTLGQGGQGALTDGISWRFYIENGRFYYRLTYTGNTDEELEIPFTVTFKDKSYSRSIRVKTVADGEKGDTGRDGLMVYPAGMYDENTTYTATSETAPVVKYGDNFYVLRRGATYKGADQPDNRNTPAKEVANAPVQDGTSTSRWQIFDKFNAIFADIIMAEFAKLGSAVFYGDWMISQQGTRNGAYSEDYQYFKDGSFIPNYSVNFKTGEINAGAGTFSGALITKFKHISESDAVPVGNYGGRLLQHDLKILAGIDVIYLPTAPSYAGARAMFCNNVRMYSRTDQTSKIAVQGDGCIYGLPNPGGTGIPSSGAYTTKSLAFLTGIIELVAVPNYNNTACDWFVVNNNTFYCNYE